MSKCYDDIDENDDCEDPSAELKPELGEALLRGLWDYDGHGELTARVHEAIDALEEFATAVWQSERTMQASSYIREWNTEKVKLTFTTRLKATLSSFNAILDCLDAHQDVGSENLLIEREAREILDRSFHDVDDLIDMKMEEKREFKSAFDSWWRTTQEHKHDVMTSDIAKVMAWEDCLYESDPRWKDFWGVD